MRDGSVTAAEVAERACAEAGLDDFGSEAFREGLERVVDSLAHAPRSFRSPQVAERTLDQAGRLLVNRLRVVDYAKRHPEVGAQRIERPLFVLGLPRTGTTLTSYLLDQDPARRSLLLWEAYDTVPPATRATLRTDPRCLALRAEQQARLAREPVHFHWEWADGPTQCTELHGHDFKATTWDRLTPSPDYTRWLEDCDATSAYAYQLLVLQVLQSRAPGPWSLKMPAHALHLDSLLRVFPDARLVWTHRDPYRAAGSVLHSRSVKLFELWGSSAPVLETLRSYYPTQLGKHVERPMRVRERIGHDRIYDLHYADLVRDPVGELAKLYAWAGDELTSETRARMERWLAENPQGKYGRHDYSLADLGLSKELLEPYFEEYLASYEVEPEGV